MESSERPPQLNPEIPSKKDGYLLQPAPEQKGDGWTPKIKETFEEARERVFSFAKHKSLKVREYFGKLSHEEEFDNLLDFDFKEQIKDNPPIQGTFSPEEALASIRSLPGTERKTALANFKDRLAGQREAWASCRVFIERSIEFNHDISKDKLMGLVEKFGIQYGFTKQQKQIAEKLIDGYYANRKKVLEIRERYPDNTSLVNELTGLRFDKTVKFEVSTGPMSIDIVADGFDAGRIYQNSKDVVVSFPYGGFATISSHEDPVLYIVINKDKQTGAIIPHEYEHQKNRLFREIFDKQANPEKENILFSRYESEQDLEVKKGLLEAYFRLETQIAFQYAKDEVIAMKKGRDLYSYDFFFKKDKSPYDYLALVRDWEQKKDDPLWQETAEKILVDDYRKIFESAVSAFDRLEKEGRYTREEIIAMFADKSLPEWPKTAKRLLEQREKG